jgi:transcriptional regulator with XRE-family HTH domain
MKKKAKPATRGVQEADKIVGERIKARRNELGVSQQDLGEKLGISFQQIQKYEKGMNRVTTGRLLQLCRASVYSCLAFSLAASSLSQLRSTDLVKCPSEPIRYAR